MQRMMRRALHTLALATALGSTLLLGACSREQAPSVNYVLLDGAKASSSQWAGKVMLVNFWATSCTTCVHEMPQMVATFDKYKNKGLGAVAVAMSYDPPAYVANFAESRKLPFDVAIDNTGAVAQAFGKVQLTPTTFLIDKQGRIVKRYVGEPDFTELHQQIETLLREG
jgi:peroxiredoxin